MAGLNQLRSELLCDNRITANEVTRIKQFIEQDGQLDLEDVKCLVELLSEATEVCPEFDELFFPVLRKVLLADGQIGFDEQFYLLKMLYSDGNVRQSEREFLLELKNAVATPTPEFESLVKTALDPSACQWD